MTITRLKEHISPYYIIPKDSETDKAKETITPLVQKNS
jgi:hypothetical protein